MYNARCKDSYESHEQQHESDGPYSQLLDAFAELPGDRLTYDRGRLEIMPPLFAHDGDGRFQEHLDRLENYAALGVGEVWRLEGNLLALPWEDGLYHPQEHSRIFPFVAPQSLLRFLRKARRAGDKMPILREFRSWVRRKSVN